MTRPAVLSINALGLALAWSLPAMAEAQDPCVTDQLCREHEDRGIKSSTQKDYASALVEFQAAYARAPIPRLLINIGRSLFRLGQPKEALKYYARFSRAEPDSAIPRLPRNCSAMWRKPRRQRQRFPGLQRFQASQWKASQWKCIRNRAEVRKETAPLR